MENKISEIPLGWNSTSDEKLRITEIKEFGHIRFNKVDSKNKVFPGPETSIENIPKIIEVLIRIYNETKEQ